MTDIIEPERWGRDHRTTLMYAETRAVDHGGVLDDRHMRSGGNVPTKYPTRLLDGSEVFHHDDYDCLRDAEAAGLLILTGLLVEFTDLGWEFVGKLRRGRAEVGFKGAKAGV